MCTLVVAVVIDVTLNQPLTLTHICECDKFLIVQQKKREISCKILPILRLLRFCNYCFMNLWRIPSLWFFRFCLNTMTLLLLCASTPGIFPSRIVCKMFADFVSDLILKYKYKMVLKEVVLFKARAYTFDYHINLKPSVFSTVTRNI